MMTSRTLLKFVRILVVPVILVTSPVLSEEKPSVDQGLFSGLKYRCIGPSRGGRVTAVAGVPSEPGTFYSGAVGGGVWKTTDYGVTWLPVSDGFLSTGSIGAIRVSLSHPNIVYVGTGSDGIRSNVITGRGVYKSNDGGTTWVFMGLRSVGQIGAVEIDPENPDIVFVAAMGDAFASGPDRGIYKSLDGGETWKKALFVSETAGAVDLEFSPDNPLIIYASIWRAERKPWTIISGGEEGGVVRSTDGGSTWHSLTEGLPTGLRGKSDLAVSPADPERVYVLIEAPPGDGGLYRSDDRGDHFRLVSTYAPLLDRPFYYCNVDADPSNADVVYVNSQSFFKSTDGGANWERRSTPHGDNHDMWIHPEDSDLYIQANDGGVNVTRDGGQTWSTQTNQPTAELYQVNLDDQFPYWLYAGQQDNSTIMVPSLPPYAPASGPTGFWRAVGGCETGPAVPKPGDPDIVYANCKGRFGRYNKRTGQEKQYYVGAANIYSHNPKDLKFRFQRVSPIEVSPHDPDIVYHASQYLHKTTDEGVTWEIISPDLTANESDKQVISGTPITRDITGEEFYSTLYAVEESPLQKGLIWVGANDGPVHVTRDGGGVWENVTPPDLPPGGRVQTLEPSPHNAAKAYFATYRYMLGDWEPYIYKTEDFGKTWERITTGHNGIPIDTPTRVIREDPDREGLLYAGTEFGMFISFDDGKQWLPFQLNLPTTPVTDIKVYRKDLVLSTMGRSFWILYNITPLHQIEAKLNQVRAFLFKPNDGYRLRYRTNRRSPADPEYPAPGIAIDYYLAQKSVKKIRLEIANGEGKIVRSFSSKSGDPKLNIEAGMHRFIWDMRHALPSATSDESNRRRQGPIVSPGTYTVTLHVNKSQTAEPFTIKVDPRVEADGVTVEDLTTLERLSLDVLALYTEAKETVKKIAEVSEKWSRLSAKGGRAALRATSLKEELERINSQLVMAEGRYQQPMIVDQIEYLYGMLSRADQKPGADAFIRIEELRKALADQTNEVNRVLSR